MKEESGTWGERETKGGIILNIQVLIYLLWSEDVGAGMPLPAHSESLLLSL